FYLAIFDIDNRYSNCESMFQIGDRRLQILYISKPPAVRMDAARMRRAGVGEVMGVFSFHRDRYALPRPQIVPLLCDRLHNACPNRPLWCLARFSTETVESAGYASAARA